MTDCEEGVVEIDFSTDEALEQAVLDLSDRYVDMSLDSAHLAKVVAESIVKNASLMAFEERTEEDIIAVVQVVLAAFMVASITKIQDMHIPYRGTIN